MNARGACWQEEGFFLVILLVTFITCSALGCSFAMLLLLVAAAAGCKA
jgi:hypothetical protein